MDAKTHFYHVHFIAVVRHAAQMNAEQTIEFIVAVVVSHVTTSHATKVIVIASEVSVVSETSIVSQVAQSTKTECIQRSKSVSTGIIVTPSVVAEHTAEAKTATTPIVSTTTITESEPIVSAILAEIIATSVKSISEIVVPAECIAIAAETAIVSIPIAIVATIVVVPRINKTCTQKFISNSEFLYIEAQSILDCTRITSTTIATNGSHVIHSAIVSEIISAKIVHSTTTIATIVSIVR